MKVQTKYLSFSIAGLYPFKSSIVQDKMEELIPRRTEYFQECHPIGSGIAETMPTKAQDKNCIRKRKSIVTLVGQYERKNNNPVVQISGNVIRKSRSFKKKGKRHQGAGFDNQIPVIENREEEEEKQKGIRQERSKSKQKNQTKVLNFEQALHRTQQKQIIPLLFKIIEGQRILDKRCHKIQENTEQMTVVCRKRREEEDRLTADVGSIKQAISAIHERLPDYDLAMRIQRKQEILQQNRIQSAKVQIQRDHVLKTMINKIKQQIQDISRLQVEFQRKEQQNYDNQKQNREKVRQQIRNLRQDLLIMSAQSRNIAQSHAYKQIDHLYSAYESLKRQIIEQMTKKNQDLSQFIEISLRGSEFINIDKLSQSVSQLSTNLCKAEQILKEQISKLSDRNDQINHGLKEQYCLLPKLTQKGLHQVEIIEPPQVKPPLSMNYSASIQVQTNAFIQWDDQRQEMIMFDRSEENNYAAKKQTASVGVQTYPLIEQEEQIQELFMLDRYEESGYAKRLLAVSVELQTGSFFSSADKGQEASLADENEERECSDKQQSIVIPEFRHILEDNRSQVGSQEQEIKNETKSQPRIPPVDSVLKTFQLTKGDLRESNNLDSLHIDHNKKDFGFSSTDCCNKQEEGLDQKPDNSKSNQILTEKKKVRSAISIEQFQKNDQESQRKVAPQSEVLLSSHHFDQCPSQVKVQSEKKSDDKARERDNSENSSAISSKQNQEVEEANEDNLDQSFSSCCSSDVNSLIQFVGDIDWEWDITVQYIEQLTQFNFFDDIFEFEDELQLFDPIFKGIKKKVKIMSNYREEKPIFTKIQNVNSLRQLNLKKNERSIQVLKVRLKKTKSLYFIKQNYGNGQIKFLIHLSWIKKRLRKTKYVDQPQVFNPNKTVQYDTLSSCQQLLEYYLMNKHDFNFKDHYSQMKQIIQRFIPELQKYCLSSENREVTIQSLNYFVVQFQKNSSKDQ